MNKTEQLENQVKKLKTRFKLFRSDYQISLEKETYRANLAERKVKDLTNEVDALKMKLSVLQKFSSKKTEERQEGN